MGAARQGRRLERLEQAALRNTHINQIEKPAVQENLRIKKVNHELAAEHTKHLLAQEKINRANRLRVRTGEVKNNPFAFTPQATGNFVRAHAHAVITDIVLKIPLLFRDGLTNELPHGAPIALQEIVQRRYIHLLAKALGHFNTAAGSNPTRRHNGMEISPVPFRNAAVMQDNAQDVLLELALTENFYRRDTNPFFKYLFGIGRHTARHLATDISHMTKHGGPIDQPAMPEHGHAHQPVIGVADGAVTRIGVGGQKNIARFNPAVIKLGETMHRRAKLSGQQPAVSVGNDRKAIALIADNRRHGGPKQQGVHLLPGGNQAVFNQVERNRINPNASERFGVRLNNRSRHGRCSLLG